MGWLLPVTSLIKEGIQLYRKKKQAKHDLEMAALEQRTKLISDEQANNHSWEINALQEKDKWVRRISFTAFTLPFVVAIFSPEDVATYFEVSIKSMPEWYVQAYMGITGSIWGISELKRMFSGTLQTFLNRNK